MADSPISPKLRKASDYLMRRLWPDFEFPPYDMYFDDHRKNQGSMQCGRSKGVMRIAAQHTFRDFRDTVSTFAHEGCHWFVFLTVEVNGYDDGDHGPAWRGEMARIGLPVSPDTTRETVEEGGLFWIAYHEILAMEFAPELASTAAIAASTAGSGGSLPAPISRGSSGQGGSSWSFRSAFSRSEPQAAQPQAGPQIRTFAPAAPVVEGPKGTSNRSNLIFADCSWSMIKATMGTDYLFHVQNRAIKHLVENAEGKCSLYGYAANVWEARSVDALRCDDASRGSDRCPGIVSGTSFATVFDWARYRQEQYNEGDHIHLFSDGEPINETISAVMDARDRTRGDISTYFIGDPDDVHAIQLMRDLARGAGSAHVVSSEAELINAVRNEIGAAPMPFSVAPRPVRDWAPERQATVNNAAQVVANQAHIVDIASSVGDALHNIAEVREEVRFLAAAQDMTTQILTHSNQALGVLADQRAADRAQHQITAANNQAWVEGASAELGRQSGVHIAGALERGALRSVEDRQQSSQSMRRLTLTTLDAGTVSRVTALMAGKGGAGALPPPSASRNAALPAPSASRNTALPAPDRSREVSLWGAPQRTAEPVKR